MSTDLRSPRLTLASANTATDATLGTVATKFMGGRAIFYGEASAFGTIVLQFKTPQGTFVAAKDVAGNAVSLAANGCQVVELPPCTVKAVLAGTTAAYAWLEGV